MPVFENFPYTNFHELNLDWIMKHVKELEDEVKAFAEILENGPVADVQGKLNGTWTSLKDAQGVAKLPPASDVDFGTVKFADSATTEEPFCVIQGAGNYEKVPVLDGNDMIDSNMLPPTTNVLMNRSGNWTSVVDAQGDAQILKANQYDFGTVKVKSSTDLSAQKTELYSDGTYDTIPTLDGSGKIDADIIPDTTVTAGTYGNAPNYNDWSYYNPYGIDVDDDGRILHIHQTPLPVIRTDVYSIAPGTYTSQINFDTANSHYPWYNNAGFLNVNLYEYDTSGKVNVLKQLALGTDYELNLYEGYVVANLLVAKTNTVYVIVNGCYGRPSM